MHRTNWDSVRSAVKSFTASTILKHTVPLVASLPTAIFVGEGIGRLVPTNYCVDLETSNGLM